MLRQIYKGLKAISGQLLVLQIAQLAERGIVVFAAMNKSPQVAGSIPALEIYIFGSFLMDEKYMWTCLMLDENRKLDFYRFYHTGGQVSYYRLNRA